MKIIYYSPHPTHDIVSEVGYATHQRETINALENLGTEVIPVIMGGTNFSDLLYTEGKAVEHKGLKFYLKNITPRFVWVSLKDWLLLKHDKKSGAVLMHTIAAGKPDLIYERSEYLQDSGIKPAKKYSIPYFIEVNAPFVQEMNELEGITIWQNLAHQKEKRKYKFADRIFVVSSVLKEFLIRKYQINEAKIVVSPNRINADHFLGKLNHAEDRMDIISEETVVGFVGSILPHHYLDLLIEAFSNVVKTGRKVKLLIVGEGFLLDGLRKMVETLGIKEQVEFLGKIRHSEIPHQIQKMDICVMPGSNWYGSPIKIFEYAILGKAIIAPDNGPVRDVMEDNEDGILIREDVKSISDALIKLIDDPSLRNRLGESFRQKVLNSYTWKDAAQLILDEYRNVLNTNREQ